MDIRGGIYHATPSFRKHEVSTTGLRVERDARKKGRIWLATLDALPGVLDHLAIRDGRAAQAWVIFRVIIEDRSDLKSCGRPGVLYTLKDVPPWNVWFAFNSFRLVGIDNLEEIEEDEWMYTERAAQKLLNRQ